MIIPDDKDDGKYEDDTRMRNRQQVDERTVYHKQYQDQDEENMRRAAMHPQELASSSSRSSSSSQQNSTHRAYSMSSSSSSSYFQDEQADLEQMVSRELRFMEMLKSRHWKIIHMVGDGACLFRAIAYHVYSDQEMHDDVRRNCIQHMRKNRDHFEPFVQMDFDQYLIRKSHPACHGNHLEIQAMSEMYNRRIEVYEYSLEPINIFQQRLPGSDAPIRLSYHNNNHYNAILDERAPSFGVGLGLPDLNPGQADQELLQQAQQQSIEEALLQQHTRDIDMETTEQDIEQMVMLQSMYDY